MASKDVAKKTETEISKQLDLMTISRTDERLKKSHDDYRSFIQKKDKRN
jgi:hypothetical protein